ncbi:hypothetical protein SAY86_008648 [Trapa natans]|uniref:Uncharacterized protein n=1 Tax=Trapa natans TaxID=22666 RepID=A0AAN7KHI9_TRANT|nr:hypothetical protein SAY86_008648 [Trapa natans]
MLDIPPSATAPTRIGTRENGEPAFSQNKEVKLNKRITTSLESCPPTVRRNASDWNYLNISDEGHGSLATGQAPPTPIDSSWESSGYEPRSFMIFNKEMGESTRGDLAVSHGGRYA